MTSPRHDVGHAFARRLRTRPAACSARHRSTRCRGCPRPSAGRSRSGPSARTATPGSPSAATRSASSSTSSPTRSRRAATRWCRSAGCSRTTPARSPASPAHLGLKAVTVQEALGRLARRRRTTRSATSSSRGSWAATSASTPPGSTSGSATAGSARSTPSSRRGGKPYPIPAGAIRPPARRAWASPTGRARSTQQEAEHGIFFDHVARVHRDRLDARGHDRRVRARGPAGPSRRRHRRIEDPASRPSTR